MAVVDDAQLATAIELLQGEWREASGCQLRLHNLDALHADSWPEKADLVVFPPRLLGALCEAGRLRPMRGSVLKSEDVALNDIYAPVRDKLMAYGGQTMALPIGCPVPLVATRNLPSGEKAPTVDWTSIAVTTPPAKEEPTLAERFLAQAASYAYHESREAVLFHPESMKPRLGEPPFVRALEELRAAHQAQEPSTHLLLPNRPGGSDPQAKADDTLTLSPLPAVGKVYDPFSNAWKVAADGGQQVTVLGIRGQLLGVAARSRNAALSFRLAGWLADKSRAPLLAAASPQVANVRRSLARRSDDWTGAGGRAAGRSVSAAFADSWKNERSFAIPRLIQIDQYLTQLDSAIGSAFEKRQPAADALSFVAEKWEDLTGKVGRDRQRKAYLRSLGVLTYDPPK